MPPIPEDKKRVADKGGTPEQPIPPVRSSFQKKLLLVLVMAVLGFPVLVVVLGPPMTGAWILWGQVALYRTDARWRQFSVFEWATRTVEPDLADDLRWPSLSSCQEFRKVEVSDSGGGGVVAGQTPGKCPHLGPWESWLLSPEAFFGSHRYVAPVLRFIPISSLLFLLGLTMAYLLRVIGAQWGARPAPPTPPPSSTYHIAGKLTPG